MKYIWLIFNVAIWTVFFGLSGIVASFFEKDKGRILGYCARWWGRTILFFCGINYSVKGLEKIDFNKTYFFASNHASAIDIPLAFAGIPIWIVSIAKIELKSIFILGWVMSTAGHIFVDRKNSDGAFRSLKKAKKTLNQQPRSVLLFPEGTRSLDGSLLPFKRGGLNMAIDLGVPIVPVACKGTFEMFKKGTKSIKNNSLELRIGEPMITKSFKKEDAKVIAKRVSERVEALLT